MPQTQLFFKVSKGSLVYAAHPNGDVTLADQPENRLDLVCHLFEGSRKDSYYHLLTQAPTMIGLLREITALDGRKGISKKSELGKRILDMVASFEDQNP